MAATTVRSRRRSASRPLGDGTPSATRAGLNAATRARIQSHTDGTSPRAPTPSAVSASAIDIVRTKAESACCWSSMRVSPSMNQAPCTRLGAANAAASDASICSSIAMPAMHIGPRADRGAHVGHRRLDDRPPATARSAPSPIDAVPAAAWLLRAANDRAPRTGLLAHPAHLAARTGPPGGVRRPARRRSAAGRGRASRERRRLGQPVGRPVVGERRPVVLDVVALRRHVCTDAIGDLAPRP